MERWARLVYRRRWWTLAAWLAVVIVAGVASAGLGALLSNRFDLPGTQSEHARVILQDLFGTRNDSTIVLVAQAPAGTSPSSPAFRAALAGAARRAAGALPGARITPIQTGSRRVAYVTLSTLLEPDAAGQRVPAVRRAIGSFAAGRLYVSGQVAINHDLQPVFDRDLARGELIAGVVAIVVLLFIFGTLTATIVPIVFAVATVSTTLGLVWIAAHQMDMAIYVRNIVTLIGLGIAIDYSLLVVYRFREELAGGRSVEDALARTMLTAGRSVVFSGLTVAVGLGLLVFLPLPFIRSMGIGSLLIPLVSIAASQTLLPALLGVLGHGVNRLRVVPQSVIDRRADPEAGFWAQLARAIMRRPVVFLVAGGTIVLVLALPALRLALTPGSSRGLPAQAQSVQGLHLLERSVGPGTLAPSDIVVDTGRAGGALAAPVLAATARLCASLRADPEVAEVACPTDLLAGGRSPAAALRLGRNFLFDPSGRYLHIVAASRHDYGTPQAQALVHRIRNDDVPAARFGAAQVLVGGGPASGVDFIERTYSSFPYLVAAVLAITYVLLLRAFRSLLLPLKAVLLNLLAVAATYGVLVLVFRDGWGTHLGLIQSPQIEAWIPIFLFAMLFGLSMDYEVFLLTRMREAWDETHDNTYAVALGLERTGRIITAAAVIMVAAFSGLAFGSLLGLQEFGVGLSVAILLDATVIRVLLVPAAMRLLGTWNWYLPAGVARVAGVEPSERRPRRPAMEPR